MAFFGILQVLATRLVSPRTRRVVDTARNGEKSTWLDFSCKITLSYGRVSNFVKIWAPKSSKYRQNLTFCPFFELQKAVLGDLIFEGSNQLQIQKFRLGWKVDFQRFPTRYLAHDLDSGKALKHRYQKVRLVKPEVRPVKQNLPVFDQFGQLSTVFTWVDYLGM